jgi:hypothetical protein
MERDGPAPGILARGSTSGCFILPGLLVAQWLGSDPIETALSAYSGGTAWALHPLRVVAGQSRVRSARDSDVSCAGQYNTYKMKYLLTVIIGRGPSHNHRPVYE